VAPGGFGQDRHDFIREPEQREPREARLEAETRPRVDRIWDQLSIPCHLLRRVRLVSPAPSGRISNNSFNWDYGFAVIKALILAKVIWLGELFGLGRNRGKRPLIYSTLWKTFLFTALVGLFALVEHMVTGLVHGVGVTGGLNELWHVGKFELLARSLVAFCAFIPFFAFRELGNVIGRSKIRELFFRNGSAVEMGAPA
jgi:hypothetical protein